MKKSRWQIFHCSRDNCWIVSVVQESGILLGVAKCPDEHTARDVKEAMELRDTVKAAQWGKKKGQPIVID